MLANTPTMHKNNSGLADRQHWCDNLHVFAQMASAAAAYRDKKDKNGPNETADLIWDLAMDIHTDTQRNDK